MSVLNRAKPKKNNLKCHKHISSALLVLILIMHYLFAGQLYGLEKFWAFLKYSRRSVDINPKLKESLSKFKRLADFRVEVRFDIKYQGLIIV